MEFPFKEIEKYRVDIYMRTLGFVDLLTNCEYIKSRVIHESQTEGLTKTR